MNEANRNRHKLDDISKAQALDFWMISSFILNTLKIYHSPFIAYECLYLSLRKEYISTAVLESLFRMSYSSHLNFGTSFIAFLMFPKLYALDCGR